MAVKVEIEYKPIPILVQVRTWGESRYEWQEVPGVEMRFEGVMLKNGDTLTIDMVATENTQGTG
jgi:hypothetical protein